MGYYSDPTASRALGNINREFSKLEKRAKKLRGQYDRGRLSPTALDRAQSEFTGIYRHVLKNALREERE